MRALEGYCTTKGSRSLLSLWVLYWAKSCSKSSVRDSGQRPATSLMALILKKNEQTECNINTMRLIFGIYKCIYLIFLPDSHDLSRVPVCHKVVGNGHDDRFDDL